ncbi:MAG: DNA-protecting protein DprA [Clostridia bacterium]|nr:DNA-protecting protein DprA [Clostridia bacterium]
MIHRENVNEKKENDNIKVYDKNKEGFPKRMTYLTGMPHKLYVIGELPEDNVPSVAIVGARECSFYGKNTAYEYARFLSQAGVRIISGLARGIDAAAHAGALAGGGKTYAVLGCGADICYPISSKKIYEQIKKQGGIISEFDPGAEPLAYHFPMRNRVISALADAVLVVEAKEKSGSLITADQALEQGRTVFAVPGRAGDALSVGCNRLIYQGAIPVWEPKIILEEMKWDKEKAEKPGVDEEKKSLGLASEDDLVYSCLDLNPKTLIQIQEETGLSSGKLLTSLIHLQTIGAAREVWKNNYIRCENQRENQYQFI